MDTATKLLEHLETELHAISQEYDSILDSAKRSYLAVEASMQALKTYVSTYPFKDAAEEIMFFKEIKPKFYCKLIYFVRLFEIETNRPDGSIETQQKYIYKQLSAIKRYSQDNINFYKYYRSGACYMDSAYFTRDKFDILIGFDTSYFDCDLKFCTSHDYKVAMLLANEMLVTYLNKSLFKLSNNRINSKLSILEDLGLVWNDSKTGFVELIYGLQSLGAFYNIKTKARADIKDIARFFEVVLDMDLGNFYRLYYDIRIRKKERTSFLDRVKDSLIKRMDDDL